eukprot:Clim_evm71s77 gene=Clim_evmTU71s77
MEAPGGPDPLASAPEPVKQAERLRAQMNQRLQKILDDATPHVAPRWAVFGGLVGLYVLRVALLNGFHIISYGLAIYLLNLFIAFLSPKFDPAMDSHLDDDEDAPALPTKGDEEFRPFIRRLPEFKFWYACTRAVCFALVCTLFPFMDVPVYWPILVMYFFVLFGVTMKRQIQHMIKYRYLPFTTGKKRYGDSKEGTIKLAGKD